MGSTVITPPAAGRQDLARLARRAGFGCTPTELDAAAGRGLSAELDRLVDPAAAGISPTPEPWASEDFLSIRQPQREAPRIIGAWLDHMLASPRPLEQRVVFMLHGLLVSSVEKVRDLGLMARQIRLYQSLAFAPYPELLTAVTTDAAMLWYLDGRDSTGNLPNENYARELMELFALGVGNYTEADVQAAARALTGWTVRNERRRGLVEFRANRHDPAPQTLLGVSAVDDVQSVVNAVVAPPAHAQFIARRVAKEFLGAATADDLAHIAAAYETAGQRVVAAVRAALELGAAGRGSPILLGPTVWLLMARRATGASPRLNRRTLAASGQIPLRPPNVAGWPGGRAWLSTSTMVARTQMAAEVARDTAQGHPLMQACADGTADDIAQQLGLPTPFGAATRTALGAIRSADGRLAAALVSPEFLLS